MRKRTKEVNGVFDEEEDLDVESDDDTEDEE